MRKLLQWIKDFLYLDPSSEVCGWCGNCWRCRAWSRMNLPHYGKFTPKFMKLLTDLQIKRFNEGIERATRPISFKTNSDE